MTTQILNDLRAKRESLNITQAQLAKSVGISRRMLCEWEGGKRDIRFQVVLKIMKRLNFCLIIDFRK